MNKDKLRKILVAAKRNLDKCETPEEVENLKAQLIKDLEDE